MRVTSRLSSGTTVELRRLENINDQPVDVPATEGRTHLQFRRFAGCPICHLHLRSFADRHREIADAGITEVVFFHSPADELRGYQAVLPFTVIADPDKVLYREFGVEKGLRSLTHPQAWRSAARGYAAARRHRNDPTYAGVGSTDGSTHLGLPADFLIDPDGTVVAVHYGQHADDQWSVDQLLDVHRQLGQM
ncbi:peroxiredoxin-like family protein [Mycolicibacter sp. MYC340]|uniref:Peroxiredoxin-like family protein n=1 Tax=[Mycobacterium] nativiensis TaxID=2855503 RepID=A0ABU5XZT2_9MYCO|nr:peroxiredoxin-like family protein [Mycolicibacter sp. MYC340]MEB3033388.1 peroxiredoxin-like family protein [Mycolicibacter sp. MYC340]